MNQLWQFEDDHAIRPLGGASELVYATSDEFHALDVETGHERWQTDGRYGAVDGDAVYVGFTREQYAKLPTAVLGAHDARNGNSRWRVEVEGWLQTDPAVGEELVAIGVSYEPGAEREGEPFHRIVALSPADGSERWRTELFPESRGESAHFISVVDDVVYVGSSADMIHALDAADGSERWVTELEQWVTESISVNEIDLDERRIFAATQRRVYVLDRTDGSVLDTFGARFYPSIGASGGTLYVGTRNLDAQVTAIDLADGVVEWQTTFEGGFDDVSVVAAETTDTVYVSLVYPAGKSGGDRDSTLYALDMATGREQWRFSADSTSFRAPLVTGDRVFVGGSGTPDSLFAIEPLGN